jgi:hypothetical protein
MADERLMTLPVVTGEMAVMYHSYRQFMEPLHRAQIMKVSAHDDVPVSLVWRSGDQMRQVIDSWYLHPISCWQIALPPPKYVT